MTLRRLAYCAALSCLALAATLTTGSCVPEDEQLPDNMLMQPDCGQRDRIDAQIKKTAPAEFVRLGKPCEADQLQTFPQNDRETLWKVCCGQAAINFIYYTQKCVVRRASGLVQCTH